MERERAIQKVYRSEIKCKARTHRDTEANDINRLCRINVHKRETKTKRKSNFSLLLRGPNLFEAASSHFSSFLLVIVKNHVIKIGCRATTGHTMRFRFNCSIYRMREFSVLFLLIIAPLPTNRAYAYALTLLLTSTNSNRVITCSFTAHSRKQQACIEQN